MSLIYIHLGYSSFVAKDIRILEQRYSLFILEFKQNPKSRIISSFWNEFFFLLLHLPKAKLVVCQFAGYHTFLPAVLGKMFGVKTLIITGGTESVSFPSINYGNFRKLFLGFFTKCSLKWCAHISPVHESLVYCDYNYQNADYPAQGIRYHIKNLNTPTTVIYNGYESELWQIPASIIKKKNSFITVAGGIDNPMRYTLKGIDLIMEMARVFPNCTFTIIGFKKVPENSSIPANVTLLTFVENSKLPALFAEYEYYLQLSISEGFPNALCEAMLCGCMPIGSAVGAIPDIIGDTGFILKKRDTEQLKNIISKALQADTETLSTAARNRISNEYPLQKREQALLNLVEILIKS